MKSKTEKQYVKAVEARGFLTSISTGFKGDAWRHAETEHMGVIDSARGYRLFGLDGYRKYSRAVSWFVHYRYLAGCERGQYWANRVPGTINTIKEALDWLKPAEVKKANRVIRQGDVFIIEKKKDCGGPLPRNHRWNPETRTLERPEHENVFVPFPAKFVSVKTMTGHAAD